MAVREFNSAVGERRPTQIVHPRTEYFHYHDCDNRNLWTISTATGTMTFSNEAGAPGVMVASTSTSATGASRGNYGTTGDLPYVIGGGPITVDMRFKVSALSDGTQTYLVRWGLSDTFGGGAPTDGIYIGLDTSGQFIFTTRKAAGSTFTTTGLSATAATWHRGRMVINSDGSAVDFWIDGTWQCQNTTNIPTNSLIFGMNMVKSAGTTARIAYLDYFSIHQKFTTAR